MEYAIGVLLTYLVMIGFIFFIIRKLVLWYFRINHMFEEQVKMNENLERTNDKLSKLVDILTDHVYEPEREGE